MAENLHVQGIPQEKLLHRDLGVQHAQDVTYLARQQVVTTAGGARAADGDLRAVAIDGDDRDVLEVETTNGLTTFTTVGQARRQATERGVGQVEELFGATRSGGGGITRLTVSKFSIDNPGIAAAREELQFELAKSVAAAGARAALTPAARWAMLRIAEWVDRPVPDDTPTEKYHASPKTRGVYLLDPSLRLEPENRKESLEPPTKNQAWLVLLHGTFSHTEAAFGQLRDTPEWTRLAKAYGDRILALEHATLSQSPLANAMDLVKVMPTGARLHLISHSRGGLIGESLSLTASDANLTDLDALLPRLSRGDQPDLRDTRADLDDLHALMKERQVNVEKFVRVACPANGTILASRRVEQYATVMFNVLKLMPALSGAGVLEAVKLLLLTFLDQRSDTRAIPGLEAQMPESPFIRYLNTRPKPVADGMGVVAGDVQGSGLAKRLKVLLADGFFREDHDMVVNTRAMVGGLKRTESRVAFFKGAPYSHSAYFGDPLSRAATLGWLTGGRDDIRTFVKSLPEQRRGGLSGSRGETGPKAGTVVIVPDLMGSSLKLHGAQVWPDPAGLVHGVAETLANRDSSVDELVSTYGSMVSFFEQSFEVVEYPYDGRDSLEDVAIGLRKKLKDLSRTSSVPGPIHFIGHGAGALVVTRAVRGVAERTTGATRPRGRCVLLSPPLDGTATVVARELGLDALTAALALVDRSRPVDVGKALKMSYASFEELKPRVRRKADDLPAADPESWDGFLAVYGRAERTFVVLPSNRGGDVPTDEPGKPVLGVSTQGDGHVLWPQGHPSLATHYSASPMHALPSDEAVLQIAAAFLRGGSSLQTVTAPPADRTGASVRVDEPPEVLFPTADDLALASMAAAGASGGSQTRLEVRVVHGDLQAARQPMILGTQFGTPIGGAEKALDRRLRGALTRHRLLGQYPGRPGTCQLFVSPGSPGPQAAVIGLGDAGELSPGSLTAGYAQAALQLVAATMDQDNRAHDVDDDQRPVTEMDLATVLIGTSTNGGLSIASAVSAAITGVRRANRRIRDLGITARVGSLSIYELYEDRAIDAVTALSRLRSSSSSDDEEELVVHDVLEAGVDARSGSPRSEYAADRWRTIRVGKSIEPGQMHTSESVFGLSFTEIGRGAGVPEEIKHSQLAIVQSLIQQGVNESIVEEQVYNTLYELLVPRSLKGQGRPSEHIMYLLDEAAVDFPWEMLATRSFDDGVVPLAVEVGMIRRLETKQLREQVRPSSARKALVIGAPYAGRAFRYLPAAVEEARLVADRLQSSGWEVTRLISTGPDDPSVDALTVLNGLFAHEYRIVHMAGHGVAPSARSAGGLVIGERSLLTALEFESLQTTPDMVFLNCCYSGSAVSRPDLLASSVGRKLIDIGVRAVVATGWRVDDEAAHAFADRFYHEMLNGEHLGTSVLRSRQAVWLRDEGRRSNTWGAYQVYGEPAFQIEREVGRASYPLMVSRRVFHESVEKLRDAAASATADQSTSIGKKLGELEVEGESHGFMRGEEYQAVGEVWRALGENEKAVKAYQRALNAGGSTATLSIVAQLVSTHAHLLREHHPDDDCRTDHVKAAEDLLAFWKKLLQPAPARDRATTPRSVDLSESWADMLKGEANLRQHQLGLANPVDRVTAIRRALKAFKRAEEAHEAIERVRPGRLSGQAVQYVCLGAVALEWLSMLYEELPPADRKARLNALVEKATQKRLAAGEGVWSMVPFERLRLPDADLVLYLLDDSPDGFGASKAEDVRRGYERVFSDGVSNRERKVIASYMEMLAQSIPNEEGFRTKREKLSEMAGWINGD